MMRVVRIVLACALILIAVTVVPTASVVAATLTVPIETHAVITDSSGNARVLIGFGELEELSGKKILYAKCLLNVVLDSCEAQPAEIEVRPVSSSWSAAQATWESPWDSSGGDLLTDRLMTVTAQRGVGASEIMMTELVQAWTNSELDNNGVALLVRTGTCSLRLTSDARFTSSGYGDLLVKYVDTSR
jgi:hypothetical protein